MEFTLTEEQLQAQKMVREFCQKEVAPIIKEADRNQTMPPNILPRLGELGILGICIPAKYGGQGFDYITLGLVCEELEALDTSLRVVMSVHLGLNSLALLQWGTEEQKIKFLKPQAQGQKYAMFGLTEPGVGSDVVNMASTARREGDTYVINGEKMWISLATKAHHILWIARTNPERPDPHEQLSAFILETDRPGLTRGDIHGKLGVRAGSTGWVHCENVQVPASQRLGEEGEGFKIAMACLDNGRYTVGSGAVGLIRASLAASLNYAHTRQTFGKEIGKHQLIQQKIAGMVRDYELGRLQYLKVGWLKNVGQRNTRETSLLKWFATEAAFQAANEAIQIHGAYGYSDEYDVERYLRNARGSIIYEGTSEIHQLLQAGYALGYRADGELRCELPGYEPQLSHLVPIKLVLISDTHNLHRRLTIPEGDILIHAGDITRRGDLADLRDFNDFMGTLPHPHKIVIAGNHDFCLERDAQQSEAVLTHCTYLRDQPLTLHGIKFYGSPWQPWFYNWAFNARRGPPIKAKWDLIPADTDVLITHGPPLGYGDQTFLRQQVGCEDLLNAIRVIKPRLHVFGHIHEAAGIFTNEYTTFVNASSCNLAYQPVQPPIIFEYAQ